MTFGGALIDLQLLCDFSIRVPFAHQFGHLLLALGQARRGELAQRRETEKTTDFADEDIDITDIRKMRPSREFDQPSTSYVRRNEPTLSHGGGAVVDAMEHKCWGSDIHEAIDHIDLVTGDQEFSRCLS
jgi:hypothetical protein